jgi:lipoprotein-releasing system ATP-binding protein
MSTKTVIRTEKLEKEFETGKNLSLKVLKGIDLEVRRSEVLIVVGPSGSGKSTLLHLLGGLDTPTAGKVLHNEQDLFALSEEERARYRNRHMGFVFQFHHLLAEFTALENVAMPALLGGMSLRNARAKASELLHAVGLSERLRHRPNELSGGEQQRVAVARALMNDPALVLADEPSGNLDQENGEKLHKLLIDLAKKRGQTFVIATHNPDLTKQGSRVVRLTDGVLTAGK